MSDFSESEILLGLNSRVYLTQSKLKDVLEVYTSLAEAVKDNFEQLDKSAIWLDKIRKSKAWGNIIRSQIEVLEKAEIGYVTYFDDGYPDFGDRFANWPVVLYYQGDLNLISNPLNLTVVGSRNTSSQTQAVMNQILKPLSGSDLRVVSGLAFGVDALSHQLALELNLPTIGIIGSGLDYESFYPKSNWGLKNQILQAGGLVLSQFAPKTKANKYTFPMRNQLLAWAGPVTWVVQASLKSGSLITAKNAADLDKKVVTCPGSVLDSKTAGNNWLLQNQEAGIILNSQDIANYYGFEVGQKNPTKIEFESELQAKIYQLLTYQGRNLDVLAQELDLTTSQLSGELSMLELSGLVRHLGENQWARAV